MKTHRRGVHTLLTDIVVALILLAALKHGLMAASLGTAFTYQGRLNSGGNPAQGSYDLRFAIYDAAASGAQIGTSLTNTATDVSNGLFTVALDFGGMFDGNARWLEIAVRTNGSGTFSTLAPRQALTPTPYALYAPSAGTAASANFVAAANISGTIPLAQLPGAVVTNNATGATLTGNFSGNGTGLSNVTATSLSGLGAVNFWQLGGNAVAAGQFLGSTNNQPVEIRVGGVRGFRLESNGSNAPNVIGGWMGNGVAPGIVGATVAGGGAGNYYGYVTTNRVDADFGTVSGGNDNAIQSNAGSATISGGYQNRIRPYASTATIGGGELNMIQPYAGSATISGGELNTIQTNAAYATISGGEQNTILTNAYAATIGGGEKNTNQVNASWTTIGGGYQNVIQTDAYASIIGGGAGNTIRIGAHHSTIGGGANNTIQTNAIGAAIPGGYWNSATSYAFAAGAQAKANHQGTFVWADSQFLDFTSTADNQFLIRASGNVGINKNNPATALDVNGTVTAGNFALGGPNYGDLKLRNDEFHGLGWYGAGKLFAGVNVNGPVLYGGSGGALGATGNGPLIALAWNNTGNVGIGTTSPDANLMINGSAYSGAESSFVGTHIKNTADGGDTTLWLQNSSKHAFLRLKNNYDTTWLKFDDGTNTRMAIDTSGNVGITTPGARLEVNGNALLNGIFANLDVVDLSFLANSAKLFVGWNLSHGGGEADFIANRGPGGGGGFSFYDVANNATVNQLMRLTGDGRVGIGTANPATALEVTGTVRATRFEGDGSALTGVASTGWSLGGNSGTDPNVNFLGTTDNQPLEIKIGGARALRLEPGGGGSVNVIGGWTGNSAAPGVAGATVAGGGAGNYAGSLYTNRVEADFGTVSGGAGNSIQSLAKDSTIGGGYNNRIYSSSRWCTIGGGEANFIFDNSDHSVVGGGRWNRVWTNSDLCTIAGGDWNEIATNCSAATISGGSINKIAAGSHGSLISGGQNNKIGEGSYGVDNATIGGGVNNYIYEGSVGATIGGGEDNWVQARDATVPGGRHNIVGGDDSLAAGYRAQALHGGSFVWADNTEADFSSTAANQFLIRAAGGVGINKTNPASALDVAGDIRLNNRDLFLRDGTDVFHGLGWYGAGKLFAGVDVNGPVLYGGSGGALGATGNGPVVALKWDNVGNVGIGTTSPQTRLHAQSAGADCSIRSETTSANAAGVLDVTAPGGTGAVFFGGFSYSAWGGPLSLNLLNVADGPIVFSHFVSGGGREQMRITSAGNVGIGTAAPAYKLDVAGDFHTSGDVWSQGWIWCNFADGWNRLDKSGSLAVWVSSDERLKQDIAPIPNAVETLQKLRGVTWNWNDTGLQHLTRDIEASWKSTSGKPEDDQKLWAKKRRETTAQLSKPQMGFIAQEVEQVYPDWVKTDEQGYKQVNMEHLGAVLVNAIKEQQTQLNAQRQQLAQKEDELHSLKARLDRLEQILSAQNGGGN